MFYVFKLPSLAERVNLNRSKHPIERLGHVRSALNDVP